MVNESAPRVTREEHIAWCKERAFEYLDLGQVANAWGSFVSDMQKHPETRSHDGLMLGSQLFVGGHLSSVSEMRHFIEGFN